MRRFPSELAADGSWEPAAAGASAAAAAGAGADRPAARGDTYRRVAGAKGQHEYHEISDEEEGGAAAAAAAEAAGATGFTSPQPFQGDVSTSASFPWGFTGLWGIYTRPVYRPMIHLLVPDQEVIGEVLSDMCRRDDKQVLNALHQFR